MPADSGGISVRSRTQNCASTASQSPAKIVIPQTSGKPPSFTARIEGAR